MREWFSFFCTAGLMLLLVGCGQESVSSSDELFSSSSAVMDLSSEPDVPSSSCLVETESSSSSEDASSSSRRVLDYYFGWDGGADTEGRVNTGSPEETSGYWYIFNDHEDGGSSRFIFPSDIEEDEDGNFLASLIDAYGGIYASVVLGEGYDYPYAGFGFNIWSEHQEGVDIRKWTGICLQYQSSIAFSMELGVENEAASPYSNYRVTVPEKKSWGYVDFPWSAFDFYPDNYDVLKNVATIKLKFEGPAGTTGDFVIEKIASLGQCSTLCKK